MRIVAQPFLKNHGLAICGQNKKVYHLLVICLVYFCCSSAAGD